MTTRSNKAGYMGNISQKHCPTITCDFPHALKVNNTRVGTGPHCDHAWLVFSGHRCKLIIVNTLVFFTNTVMDNLKELTGKISGVAVREMAAMAEVHG